MKLKIATLCICLVVLLAACDQSSSNYDYYDNYDNTTKVTTETTAVKKSYDSAVEILGESYVDIKSSNISHKVINNIADFDQYTTVPYTLLLDSAQRNVMAVFCKGNAKVSSTTPVSMSIAKVNEILGVSEISLYWSAATNTHYKDLKLTTDGSEYIVRYMWEPLGFSNNMFDIDSSADSDFCFVCIPNYITVTGNDFMGYDWDDSIYSVRDSLTSKGFYAQDAILVSNCFTIKSISEKLYGCDFYAHFYYNDNMSFTKGKYEIVGSASQKCDAFESALESLLNKYGDTYNMELPYGYGSIDEVLSYIRQNNEIPYYQFETKLMWNYNGYTAITLQIYGGSLEIIYTSINATGGTRLSDSDLL